MSVQIKDRIDPALPSDITLRAPIYRRHGVISALLVSLVAVGANFRLDRARKRYRSDYAPSVPDHLREDVGLPPREIEWWELHP